MSNMFWSARGAHSLWCSQRPPVHTNEPSNALTQTGNSWMRYRLTSNAIERSWEFLHNPSHAQLGMRGVISSTRSCCVTPSKHRLLQHSRASPVSTAWHDPEAECGSPDRCKGSCTCILRLIR